jgi:Tol biopolymer transport system component
MAVQIGLERAEQPEIHGCFYHGPAVVDRRLPGLYRALMRSREPERPSYGGGEMHRRSPIVSLALLAAVAAAALLPARSEAHRATGNGAIAFSSLVHGTAQVFTVEPDGSRLRQVTHGSLGSGQFGLSWSPDGRSLLYTVTHPQGPDAIMRSRADGSDANVISPACTGVCLGDDNPVYSPDGKKIAFERAFGHVVDGLASGGVAIFTMNADGTGVTRLSPKGTSENSQPRWSPDGRTIAFVRFDEGRKKGAIELMNAAGGSVRRLTPFRIDATDPRWAPDGKRLLFSTYADPVPGQSANLFTMRRDGTHRVALTRFAGGALQALADDWSPDGTEVLFRRMRFSGIDTEVGGFYVLTIRGKTMRRLTPVRIRDDALAAWGRKP